MKIGLVLPGYARWFRGDGIWAICEKAKEIGVDSLHFEDHVIVTPFQNVGQGNGFMDIWTSMAYVAAVTNVQHWAPTLEQNVCVVPYRPAIQQAKVAATVDSLSGGRLKLGAGTGYNPEEFGALGLNVHERGDMTDEYLKCMIELWTHPVASFHGKYVNFDEMTISVRPTQQPHPPILVGASGKRPFRRIAEYCQGWVPGLGGREGGSLKTLEEGWEEINRLWKEYGRQGKPYFEVGGVRHHLTMDRAQAGKSVVKGVAAEGVAPAGQEVHRSTFPMAHVNELVGQIRSAGDIGVDTYVVHLPSYKYGEFTDNQAMMTNQLEMLGEHVLPKIR